MSFLVEDEQFLKLRPHLKEISIIQFATWDFSEKFEEYPIAVIEYLNARGAYVALGESDLWRFMHIWRNVIKSTFSIEARYLVEQLDEKEVEILVSSAGGNIPEVDGPLR